MAATLRFSLFLCLLLTAPAREVRAADDPFEPFNRSVFAFNQAVRAQALAPLAEAYLDVAPPEFRRGVATAFSNLREPVTALSAAAAGRLDAIAAAAARFAINSTYGVFGAVDRAAEFGFERAAISPGDALCAWGLPSGPYLVLPLLGPTTARDAGAAAVVGAVMSSAVGGAVYGAASGFDALHAYAEAHRDAARLEADAVDLYALHRSVYLQRRAQSCPVDRAALNEDLAGGFAPDGDD